MVGCHIPPVTGFRSTPAVSFPTLAVASKFFFFKMLTCAIPTCRCDARSVDKVELCRSSVGGAGKFGKSASMGGDSSLEFYSSLYSSQHEWYWFPQMLNTEVLLIKTYDSDPSSGVFHLTLHSAFNDESTSPDAPERQSCEARVLCLIPKSSPKL